MPGIYHKLFYFHFHNMILSVGSLLMSYRSLSRVIVTGFYL